MVVIAGSIDVNTSTHSVVKIKKLGNADNIKISHFKVTRLLTLKCETKTETSKKDKDAQSCNEMIQFQYPNVSMQYHDSFFSSPIYKRFSYFIKWCVRPIEAAS